MRMTRTHGPLASPLLLLLLVAPMALMLAGRGAQAKPQQDIAKFAEWLKQKDVEVGPLQIRDLGRGHGGRGVFAAEDIEGGTRVIRVPIYKAALSLEHAFDTPVLGDMARNIGFPDDDLWAVFLSYELQRPDSPWGDYLRVFPKASAMVNPLFFSDDELALLKGSATEQFIRTRKNAIAKNYEKFNAPIFHFSPPVFTSKDQYSLEDHMWGLATVWSRVMEIKVKNKVENMNKDNDMGSAWVSARVFVPMVDMINTGTPEEINVICRTHQSGLFVDCVTDRDIPAGTELLRTYHEGKDLSNSQFFVDFGIAFEHNQNDIIPLPMPDMKNVPNLGIKEKLMSAFPEEVKTSLSHETHNQNEMSLSWKTGLFQYPGLMAFMRILSLTNKDLAKYSPVQILNKIAKDKPVSKGSETLVVRAFVSAINARLAMYPTTVDEDSALLDELYKDDAFHDFDKNSNKRLIYTLLFAEKRMLKVHIDLINKHMDDLVARIKAAKAALADSSPASTTLPAVEDDDGDYKINKAWKSSKQEL